MGTRINAWRIHTHGGPEVMSWESVQLAMPRPGEVTIRHTAIGINDIDLEQRSGSYAVDLPSGLGLEAVGVVEIVAPDVVHLSRGDRVAYAGAPAGAYSEAANVTASRLVRVPDHIPDSIAGALLDGLIVSYLLLEVQPVVRRDVVLVTDAVSGPGSILCQWAQHLGATVIATARSPEKAAVAAACGAHHVLIPHQQSLRERLEALELDKAVTAAFDFDRADDLQTEIGRIAPAGRLVRCNERSLRAEAPRSFSRVELARRATRTPQLHAIAENLFRAVAAGGVPIAVDHMYPLRKAKEAHADRETHAAVGSAVLLP